MLPCVTGFAGPTSASCNCSNCPATACLCIQGSGLGRKCGESMANVKSATSESKADVRSATAEAKAHIGWCVCRSLRHWNRGQVLEPRTSLSLMHGRNAAHWQQSACLSKRCVLVYPPVLTTDGSGAHFQPIIFSPVQQLLLLLLNIQWRFTSSAPNW